MLRLIEQDLAMQTSTGLFHTNDKLRLIFIEPDSTVSIVIMSLCVQIALYFP